VGDYPSGKHEAVMDRAIKIVLLSVLYAISVLVFGCEGPQGPKGLSGVQQVYITAEVVSEPILWPSGPPYPISAKVRVSNVSSIPGVEVSGDPISLNGAEGDEFLFFNDGQWGIPIALGDSVHLVVECNDVNGNPVFAEADAVLPGSFSIVYPDTSNDLETPWGEDLTLIWTASEGADVYYLSLNLSVCYYDSGGTHEDIYIDLETQTCDTTITFELSGYFPDYALIDSLNYSYGGIDIIAHNGPYNEGDMGNISGDAIGFFIGETLVMAEVEVVEPD
jgi:hypothetical protein